MNRGRVRIWSAVLLVAGTGLVGTEIAKRANVHDYSSQFKPMEWPESLTLDRSDLGQYLRHQFNVDAHAKPGGDDRLAVHAGLCQLAGKSELQPADVLAAEATLLVAHQPWFDEFVEAERDLLIELRNTDGWSPEQIRVRFIRDLADHEMFAPEFARALEQAAAERGLRLLWIDRTSAAE